MRWLAVCVCAVLVAAPSSTASTADVLTGDSIAKKLLAGQAVVVTGSSVVSGEIYLYAKQVRGAFTCLGCTLAGGIDAVDADFHQGLTFDDARVNGRLNFHGARFERAVVIGAAPVLPGLVTRVSGQIDFSLATFASTANFENLEAASFADFTLARFQDTGIFNSARLTGSNFRSAVSFIGAEFDREARFVDATLRADFTNADFHGGADFRRATFPTDGLFLGTNFAGAVDFGDAQLGGSDFANARFHQGANFKRAAASNNIRFVGARSNGPLDFQAARFAAVANFTDVEVDGMLSFEHTRFARSGCTAAACGRSTFIARNLSADDLRMPIALARRTLRPTATSLLQQIERSAKARGDFGTANDAFYNRQVVKSGGYGPLGRLLDFVFYRGAAGYLVKPEHPLVLLLLLALVAATLEARSRWREHKAPLRARKPAAIAGLAWDVGSEALRRIAGAIPKRLGGNAQPLPRLELTVYRILLVCTVIGVWANPTLREYVNLLR
jgi:Pentapeptide repeats (9 copies)